MPNNESGSRVPTEFFTVQSFKTLGGCVVAAGVVASVICGVFGLDPKIIGLIVSICVAYAAVFLTKRRKRADYVVAGFNGFLIYFTLVGATSFFPYLNKQTAAADVGSGKAETSVFSPWVRDPNLVQVSRDLVQINREQAKALTEVHANVAVLEKQVGALNIPPAARSEIMGGLARNKNLILMTRTNIAPRITTLDRLGIHP